MPNPAGPWPQPKHLYWRGDPTVCVRCGGRIEDGDELESVTRWDRPRVTVQATHLTCPAPEGQP